MSKRFVARALAALLLFASFAANSAGLGTLRVLSALGEPLRAEIDIVSLRRGEQDTLSVRLASSEAFRQAGVEFHPALIGLQLAIQRRDGQPIVALTSRGPVNEPFLEMLVELEWAGGRLVREYTVLLDPPTYIPPPPAGAVMGPTTPAVTAPAQPVTPAAPAEPSAAAAPSAAITPAVDYEVVKGDTLSKIAREHMHGGVTFNQMMIAIYRANQEAFIRENINLVRAGRILRIPDRDEVAAVGRDEAKEVVLEHMARFAEYRRQIAAAAPTAPGTAGARTAEGQITTDAGKAEPEGSRDQLKLSRAEPEKAGAPSAAAAAAREDDRVARDRELEEAQSRVGELEKNIGDLQKLLEIKNQQIAQLEQSATAAAPEGKPAAEAPKPAVEAPKPAVEAPKPAAEAPKPAAQPAKPAAEAPKPAPAKPRPVAPAPQPEANLLDEYLGDPLMLGGLGLVILLLVGYGAYAWKRKKRAAQSQMGDSLLNVAAAGGALAGGEAVAAGPGLGMEAEEVDPLAEADVYLAYGRDTQAEEILREALQKDASRAAIHEKLLEIYAKRRDAKAFEAAALKLKGLVNEQGPEWEKAMALGRSIDPGNSLYGEGEAAPVMPDFGAPEAAPAVDFNIEATTTGINRTGADATLDFDLGGATSEEPAAAEAGAEERPKLVDTTGPLDFDLGTTTMEKSPVAEEPAAGAPAGGGGLDFELSLDTGERPAAAEESAPGGGEATDLGMISLDLGGGEGEAAAPGGGGDAKWQEVATKLDLAKAYEEMGDKDGARELLNEVAREGDAAQQAQAQQMLASLG